MKNSYRTRFRSLATVFPYRPDTQEHNVLHARIARVCVLYEDLRLEAIGIFDDTVLGGTAKIPEVEPEARQVYFLRRAFATLREFTDALRKLDTDDAFQAIKGRFSNAELADWQRAKKHFKLIDKRLRKVRNQIGGHFGEDDALNALAHFANGERGKHGRFAEPIGKISIDGRRRSEPGLPLRLDFACEITITAILNPNAESTAQTLRFLTEDLFGKSYVEVCTVMRLVAVHWLMGRFN